MKISKELLARLLLLSNTDYYADEDEAFCALDDINELLKKEFPEVEESNG